MEHRTSAEFKGYAAVIRPQELSKKELLERWSLSLEKRSGLRLCTLRETEHKSLKEQVSLRKDNSPLTLPSRIRCCDRQVWRAINLARSHDFLGYHLGSFTTWCVTAILGETVAAEVVAARVRRLSGRARSFTAFACTYAIAATLLAATVLMIH